MIQFMTNTGMSSLNRLHIRYINGYVNNSRLSCLTWEAEINQDDLIWYKMSGYRGGDY